MYGVGKLLTAAYQGYQKGEQRAAARKKLIDEKEWNDWVGEIEQNANYILNVGNQNSESLKTYRQQRITLFVEGFGKGAEWQKKIIDDVIKSSVLIAKSPYKNLIESASVLSINGNDLDLKDLRGRVLLSFSTAMGWYQKKQS